MMIPEDFYRSRTALLLAIGCLILDAVIIVKLLHP